MSNLREEMSWTLPSNDILKLFGSKPTESSVAETRDPTVHQQATSDSAVFTEEDYARMPSTLMKAIRRTETLLLETEKARTMAINTNNELKSIYGLMVRYGKKHLKDVEKTAEEDEVVEKRGFRRPGLISDDMCDFIGVPHGTLLSRVDVNTAINDYIKQHQLIDPANGQTITPDETLSMLLSEGAQEAKLTYFSLQKYIKHHFLKSKQ